MIINDRSGDIAGEDAYFTISRAVSCQRCVVGVNDPLDCSRTGRQFPALPLMAGRITHGCRLGSLEKTEAAGKQMGI